MGYDDSLDVFGVHAIGGIVGALLTGVFALKAIGGVESSIALQAIGVVSTIIYASAVTAVILVVLDKIIGLRVEMDEENEGLDLEQHGEHVL
jgi:Amt family ammonium transporter